MPNNTRTQADGVYVSGYAMPSTDWEDLERKIFHSWNGDRGGAYSPTEKVIIGDQGLQVTGPLRLSGGGTLYIETFTATIRDGTWPQLKAGHAGRTRSIVQPLHGATLVNQHLWTKNHPYVGYGSVALSCKQSTSREIERPEIYMPLRVVNGSTLKSVTFHFRVASPRTAAPVAMPKVRIVRMAMDGPPIEALKATADGLGFDSPALVTSPVAWYANGDAQTFTYVCDQNNVIDDASYAYLVHIVEEQGVLTPDEPLDGIKLVERKADVDYIVVNSEDLTGSVNTEGAATVNDERVVVVDDDATLATGKTISASAKNGIWLAKIDGVTSGAWIRSTDCDDSADFTRNWIVRVKFGHVNAGSTWQCVGPSSDQKVNLVGGIQDPGGALGVVTDAVASASHSQPRIIPARPMGNIWHAVVPTFEVTNLQFQ